jgi:cyclic pyranopterin phosphate synthase
MSELSHYTPDGRSRMVDIGGKEKTNRMARARGSVRMKAETLHLIQSRLLPKGDPFEVARIAGIMAAKKTPELIPMCHPLSMSFIDVTIVPDETLPGVAISSEVRLEDRTGAEMEALVSVSVAALTIYDMCKAVDSTIVIDNIMLVEKHGGKSDKP